MNDLYNRKFTVLLFVVLTTCFTCAARAQTVTELIARSSVSNGEIYLDISASDDDNNALGTESDPVKSISEAVEKSYAYAASIIYVKSGTYSASRSDSVGGRVLINAHPRLVFKPWPNTTGTITFNAGFTIRNGASVVFREINFNQNGGMSGLPQIFAENSSVAVDDGNASYGQNGEGEGFLRAVNSWASIRVSSNRLPEPKNVFIDYRVSNGGGAIIEADYGSYLFITGHKGCVEDPSKCANPNGSNNSNPRLVKVLMSATTAQGVYLTGSKLYASNLTIQGSGNNGIGLLMNRMSQGRILSHANQSLTWFYNLEDAIFSQNGSSLYVSGPVRIRNNLRGLRVDTGADIKYSDEVQSFLGGNEYSTFDPNTQLINGNPGNTTLPVPANVLRAY